MAEELVNRNYVRWDDPEVEKTPPAEEADIKTVVEQINGVQMAMWNMHRHAYSGESSLEILSISRRLEKRLTGSGTHARTQGVVKGKLVVPYDLPKHLKQSMFAHGGEYPVVCRYSSEAPDAGLDVRLPLTPLNGD